MARLISEARSLGALESRERFLADSIKQFNGTANRLANEVSRLDRLDKKPAGLSIHDTVKFYGVLSLGLHWSCGIVMNLVTVTSVGVAVNDVFTAVADVMITFADVSVSVASD